MTGVTLVKFAISAASALPPSEATASRAPCSVAKLRIVVAK
jgi:hypothetical protein